MAENNDASPPAPAFRLRWDVFLSFAASDTPRHGFTNRLYQVLLAEGLRTFLDVNEGTSNVDGEINAIRDCAAAIAVVSPGYASSRRRLEGLATICECRKLLLPVFFNVDPSHVRRQEGPFEEDFGRLERSFGAEKVVRWRDAMAKAGGISGWVYEDSEEPELIKFLVSRILAELSNSPMGVASYAVGLNSRVEKVLRLLDLKSNGIQVLGLHGIGGVGKTTLAKAVYNKLVSQFEHRSFMSNVRETSMQPNGLISLQNQLLLDLSGRASQVDDVNAEKNSIERMLHEKRVLIVLDDVDTASCLGALVAKREWLYEGSRIIITTRDRDVLIAHHVNEMYEVRALGSSDSLDLFHYHALRTKKASETFLSLSKQIVSLTGGLPLALEVFGSFLFDKRRVEEWEDALQKLRQIRPHHLQDVLRISFDGLDEEEQCIFLDIACLFVNLQMRRDEVIDIVKGCGFRAEIAINVLVARSLVKFQESSIWMHDQIRDMGRQIVQNESLADPGMRSRLWDHSEILMVLKDRMGTRCTRGIILDFEKNHKGVIPKSLRLDIFQMTPHITSVITYLMGLWKEYFNYGAKKEGEVILQTKPFQYMVCLRLLQLSNVRLVGNFKCLPPELKWLRWRKCPLKNLPSNFCAHQLAVLDLSDSKIENVWGLRWWSWCKNKVAENLMVMNLHGCYNLTAVPDLSSHYALEKLILEGCTSLTAIHKSLGETTTLRHLNLRDCSNLVDFPNDVSGLKHLETLVLSGCSKLKELPQNMDCLSFLRKLLVDNTAIERLPASMFRLTKLEVLNLDECQSLKRLPPSIGQLGSLRDLSLNGLALEELPDSIGCLLNLETLWLMRCKSLTLIPGSVGNLRMLAKLWLNGSSVMGLPASIGSLSYLKELFVGNCSFLTKLPVSIGGLASLVELQLDGTSIVDLPDMVDGLKSLEKLQMRNCESLRSLPDSIGYLVTLTSLIIVNASIVELPESIGMLENLTTLTLNNCAKLCRLPSSIGNLKFLDHLYMEETSVTELPESFGMLSRLTMLKMRKNPYREVSKDAETTEIANKPVVLPSFSNLSVLEEFDASGWKLFGKIPDDFEKLSCLETLRLGHNDFHSLPCSLRGLSILKKLFLPHCENLRVLPPLPSSLLELNAESCTALETLSDFSNLENLYDLNLANCVKLRGIPGLECLKSLRRLYMGGCSSCSSLAKRKLDKLALKSMYNLSVPGSEIPEWFTPEVICYSKPKNLVIKAVIVGIVVSINHQIPDPLRDKLAYVAGIEIRILRENELKPIYTTVPRLSGVSKNDEDHFYLCRYPYFRPLVLCLQEGDKIEVARRNPPVVNGVQLKKCGIHLVFENDDDYDGDESWLHESQQSVSQKLATFVGSEEDTRTRDNISGNDGETEGRRQSRSLSSSNHRNYFVLLFVAFPSAFLLLSWLVFMFFT